MCVVRSCAVSLPPRSAGDLAKGRFSWDVTTGRTPAPSHERPETLELKYSYTTFAHILHIMPDILTDYPLSLSIFKRTFLYRAFSNQAGESRLQRLPLCSWSMPISHQRRLRLARRGHFSDAHGVPRAEHRAVRRARVRYEARARHGVEDDAARRPREARARRRAIVRFARRIIHSRARVRSSPRAGRHPARLRHRQAVRRHRVGRRL